jgi:hypothetical protein
MYIVKNLRGFYQVLRQNHQFGHKIRCIVQFCFEQLLQSDTEYNYRQIHTMFHITIHIPFENLSNQAFQAVRELERALYR